MEARIYVTPLMCLPYTYWQMWMEMVVRQRLPLAERAVNDASAQAELNIVQPDAPPRYVG
jgi:hypothetical protein